ncbi:MAG: hypothetical protein ACJ73U_15540, partial [Actinophytocola sp.]
MPDDERLGGTRDPHEYGRRHRRDETPPPPPTEEQPRRRRRSVESGGVSVADLVQRHTGSRPDLTPVNPDQLRQNGVMTGRRARQDEPPNRSGSAPSIASALEDGAPFPPDQAAPPRAPESVENFPRDEAQSRRPGGNSSYFTIPSDAIRSSFSSEVAEPPAQDTPFPTDFPDDDGPTSRPRGIGEGSGPRTALPPDMGGPRRTRRVRDRGDGFDAFDGGARRPGEASAHYPVPGTEPRRPGEASAHHPVPGTQDPRRNGLRQPGQTSAQFLATDAPGRFSPDPDAPRRRAGETSGHHGFPSTPEPSHRNGGRHVGEASGLHGIPGTDAPNGFPPDPDAPHRNSAHRAGETSGLHGTDAPNGFAPDPEASRRNGNRRPGEASGLFGAPGTDAPNGFPPDSDAPHPHGARRMGEASGLHGAPGSDAPNGFLPDAEGSHRNSRRSGEASGLPGTDAPNGFPPGAEAPRRSSRRAGENSGLHGAP